MKLLIGLLFIAGTCGAFFAYKDHSSNAGQDLPGKQPITATNEAVSTGEFQPTLENHRFRSGAVPKGMVWIPGGEFSMGANDPPEKTGVGMKATTDARPIHRVYVDGFYMDKTDVTNAQFAEFVRATGYTTIAERTPQADDFPAA